MEIVKQYFAFAFGDMLEFVGFKFPKCNLWIFVPKMMVHSLTNSVNFPAKKLDRGRFHIHDKN